MNQKVFFLKFFFKSIKSNNYKSPLILISSIKLLKFNLKKYNFKKRINILDKKILNINNLSNKNINLIDIDYKSKSNQKDSANFIKDCFNTAFDILKSGLTNKFINGPIDKSTFLDKKYLGLTEYISSKFENNNVAMLIYNKDLSVCPLTTHLPLKLVSKSINKSIINNKVRLINSFYLKNLGFKPKIAITGLNPHCESILKFNEDDKIIKPTIKSLKKKGYYVSGPFSADTIFLKQNRKKIRCCNRNVSRSSSCSY